MNAYHKKQKLKKRKSIYRKWHRRIGFAAAVFLLNLSVTGIILNHYESLGLHQNFIQSSWLLDIYKVPQPENIKCYSADTNTLCQIDNQLFVNGQFWQESESSLLGLAELSEFNAVITRDSIMLVDNKMRLIDSISIVDEFKLKAKMVRLIKSQLFIMLNDVWHEFDLENEEWSRPLRDPQNNHAQFKQAEEIAESTLSNSDKSQYFQRYRERQITQLRFVQDLHSGRIIGLSGQLFNDIAGVILILLVISGFIAWQRRKNNPTD